jgi:hypothetical protein
MFLHGHVAYILTYLIQNTLICVANSIFKKRIKRAMQSLPLIQAYQLFIRKLKEDANHAT